MWAVDWAGCWVARSVVLRDVKMVAVRVERWGVLWVVMRVAPQAEHLVALKVVWWVEH